MDRSGMVVLAGGILVDLRSSPDHRPAAGSACALDIPSALWPGFTTRRGSRLRHHVRPVCDLPTLADNEMGYSHIAGARIENARRTWKVGSQELLEQGGYEEV